MKGEHFAAITDPKDAGELLCARDSYQGTLTVQCAVRLAPLVFVRPGELRAARWADGVRPDYIEHQLAHAVRDPNGRAYNRTAHLPSAER